MKAGQARRAWIVTGIAVLTLAAVVAQAALAAVIR